MKDRFLTNLTSLSGDPFSKKFLLAVSGGKDSSALVHLFHRHKIPFEIAHCNFHLREEESDQDMQFVMEMGLNYQCNIHLKEFYHEDFQSIKGKSIEMIARDFRYQWFEKLAPDFDFIVTAHHANDNAETLLLNLIRGTGLKGLTGIPPANGKIIRPLLSFTSVEIEEYLSLNHLPYCVDRTNLQDEYQRNKIRLNIIPQLEEINPSVIRTFQHNMEIFQKQYHLYNRYIQEIRERLLQKKSNHFLIEKEALLAHSEDTELILYELLTPFGFSNDTIRNISRNLSGQSGKKYYSSSHFIVQERKRLIISKMKDYKQKPVIIQNVKTLEQLGFEVELLRKDGAVDFEDDRRVCYMDAELLKFPLTLRTWQHGDSFCPLGMNGKKKVSDFFNDQKIDNYSKYHILLLLTEEKIAWIVGHRSDHRFRITDKTTDYYKITYYGANI